MAPLGEKDTGGGAHMSDTNDKIRIVQETVAGKEITFAHVIGGPAPIIYQKLGLNPNVDYQQAAIGILSMTPSESSVIAGGIATKTSKVEMGFIDRFSGTLIFTGRISNVQAAVSSILTYLKDHLGFTICEITRT